MALFSNISEFKQHVGGAVNVSLELDSIQPTLLDAARLHIIPWLGEALWAKMDDGTGLSPAETNLLPYVQAAAAKLAMYEYAFIGGIQFSESGIHRTVSETMTSAYKYQENDYRRAMLTSGYEAVEYMLKHLDTNKGSLSDWTSDPASERHNTYFVRYASEMRMHYSKYVSRYTYEILRAAIEDVEASAIESTLPKQLYARLKAKYLAADGSAAEKKAIFLVQRAIVHFAIEEATERHWCAIEGNAVVQFEQGDSQSSTYRRIPEARPVEAKRRHHDLWANRHLSRLRDYILEQGAAEFPLAFCAADGGTNTDPDAWCPTAEAAAETETSCACDRPKPYWDDTCCATASTPKVVSF